MAKYTYEFKKEIVNAYIRNKGSEAYLVKKYGVKSKGNVNKWIKAYEKLGDDGLRRSINNNKYTFNFKLSVVELYLSTEVSYQNLALEFGINNPSLLIRWVNNFRMAGPDALREKCKGGKTMINKEKNDKIKNNNNDYIKKLENDNLKLKIENAYLKELRRLRLEKETPNK